MMRCDLMACSVVLCSFFVLGSTVFVLQNCTVSIRGHVDSSSIMLLVIYLYCSCSKKKLLVLSCVVVL